MTQLLQENLAKLLQSSDGVFGDRVVITIIFFAVVIVGKPILLHIVILLATHIHGRRNKLNSIFLNTDVAVRPPESIRSHKMRKHS